MIVLLLPTVLARGGIPTEQAPRVIFRVAKLALLLLVVLVRRGAAPRQAPLLASLARMLGGKPRGKTLHMFV
jgi:hypothetical protein